MNLETLQNQWRRPADGSQEWESELDDSPARVDCGDWGVGSGEWGVGSGDWGLNDEPSPN